MDFSAPPPPPSLGQPVKKSKWSGWTYLGCGCLALIVLGVVILGCLILFGYFVESSVKAVSSTTSVDIPTFDGGDEVYKRAMSKWNLLLDSVNKDQPNTITFTADELNTLCARSSLATATKSSAFIQIGDGSCLVKFSVSTDLLGAFIPNRFINGEASFIPRFESHQPNIQLLSLKLGDKITQASQLPASSEQVNGALAGLIARSPDYKDFCDHIKKVSVVGNQLVVDVE